MTIDEIVAQLSVQQPKQPLAAYAAAEEQRPVLTERFLAELQKMVEAPQAHLEQAEGVFSSYALYFLAKWREPRAYPLLIQLCRQPQELLLELTGDILPLHGAVLLASVQNGDIAPIQSLIEDAQVADVVRAQAILALAVLVAWEERVRQEMIDYYARLFQGGLRPRTRSQAWTALVSAAVHLEAWTLLEEMERALEAKWVDESAVDAEGIRNARSASPGATFAVFASRFQPITDIAEVTRWWTCFTEPAPALDEPGEAPAPGGPIDIGRNDPCPCGSGLKYKKCCGKDA